MKVRAVFRCHECGYETSKWLGKCPDCGSWNSLIEEAVRAQPPRASGGLRGPSAASAAKSLAEISFSDVKRIPTGFTEFDGVLGGGIVPGSLILLGGEPGIGKSTLLLQVLFSLASGGDGSGAPMASVPEKENLFILVSGEESAEQIKLRAERLGVTPELLVLAETDLLVIEATLEELKPTCAVIDSIQTIYNPEMTSAPGSVSQVREGAARLMRVAKSLGIALFIVGHVTKDGAIAGPRLLEHMVDTVLYFEGDMQHNYRILRASKNRFGSTGEIAVFSMVNEGLCEVTNPSEIFLPAEEELSRSDGGAATTTGVPGSVVVATSEGRRGLLAEIQALVTPTSFGQARRLAQGVEASRLALILAVMQQRGGVPMDTDDVYVSVSGGLKLIDPGCDLAVALAVYSAKREIGLPRDVAVFGEITLAGELRPVSGYRKRVDEAMSLGYRRVLGPPPGRADRRELASIEGEIIEARSLREALTWLIEGA